jgi:hypothetical protein
MALAVTVKEPMRTSTGVSTVDSAGFACTNGLLYIALVFSRLAAGSGVPNTPTVSGNGLTWVQCGTPYSVHEATSNTDWKITAFRARVASGAGTGAVTASFGGQNQTRAFISVVEVSGAQAGGTDGDVAVAQAVGNSVATLGTSGLITMAAFASSLNAVIAGWLHTTGENTTPESLWTEIGDLNGSGSGAESAYRLAADNTPTATWGNGSAYVGIALELVALVTTLSPASVVHTRGPTSPKVNPNLTPASVVHARAVNSGTKLTYVLTTASITHARALSTGTIINPQLKPASAVHTRALTAPSLTKNLNTASVVHSRSVNSGTKLSPQIKPLSVVHNRFLGHPSVNQGTPYIPLMLQYCYTNEWRQWTWDPEVIST